MKNQKSYYIGLDIGTDSIGWAVTDTKYNILKFNGNAQWGIRLLDESNTAEERRGFRSSRRRTLRNKFRIQCLEMLFNKEIAKRDVAFFQRLHDSNLWEEDKSVQGKYSLFNDADFTDKDYHKQYPTIYHLRKRLVESGEPADVRLVYLAINHIVKNRGHFLFDSDSLGGNATPCFEDIWNELTVCLADELDVSLECKNTTNVCDILKNKSLTVTAKKQALLNEFSVDKKSEPTASVFTLLSGGTASAANLFSDESLKDTEAAKIVFSSGYDEKAAVYEATLGERFEVLERLKAVYDWALLADILNNQNYISFAKCDVYDKHRRDLKILKAFVKTFVPEKYKLIFSENKKGLCNYLAYSGYCSKGSVEKKCQQQDFLDFLKKQLPKDNTDEKYAQMYSEIASGAFLPKLVSKDNAVIPMQLNKAELIAILKNASEYLPFLKEKDEFGKTMSEKILDVFSFRIPYYVGPLNKHSKYSWIERTDEKIYPWNFDTVVDVDKSAERFIENLTSKCTYIFSADVLPKNSLLYSKFAVLNELNNLKIDGKEITVELKQGIYQELFEQSNKVTVARLKKYLKSSYGIDGEITGIDGDFKNSLKPYRDLLCYALTTSEKEEIIKAITIFGDDKKLLKKRLYALFGDKLSKDDINRISKLKYTGWGRLSSDFLSGLEAPCLETGEVNNIIGFMWETNCNLMQLLSNNYGFLCAIDETNGDRKFTTLRKEVEELYVSPKVKRPIYQAMQIVEELVKINHCQPEKIFVEVARGGEEKKERKVSRKDSLLELYKACKKDNEALYEKLYATDENEFRRDALYLYYTQFGKCMYTGKDISIEDIYNKNLYDIDHIFPRSKIKDDSLDNRVLVTKESNEKKSNIYPIAQSIRDDRLGFWKTLLDKKLISQKKFDRLTRSTPLTDDELSSFINRQLVETRQSTKAIAQLLRKRYESEVVYVKAGLVSDFRTDYKFIKCREINDLHHAKDAYLNIVVGNVYNTRFNHNRFIFDLQEGKVSLNQMFAYDTDKAWSAVGEEKSIDVVKKTMAKNNIRFTRYSFKQKGGLFDSNILKKGSGQVSVKFNSPLSNIEKYGGYNKAKSTCFSLVSYVDEKGQTVKQFIPIDLYEEHKYLANPKAFIDGKYSIDSTIIIPCVKYNTLVSVDGFRMHISSKSSGGADIIYKPAMQLVLDSESEMYAKKIAKYLEKCAELKKEKPITQLDGITYDKNILLYDTLSDKLNNTVLNVKFTNTAKIMRDKKPVFEKLSLKEQGEVIMQILNIVHANVRSGDLSLLGESKKSGIVTSSSKISPTKNIKSFKIINQSITGLFEQEIELLD